MSFVSATIRQKLIARNLVTETQPQFAEERDYE